MLSALSTRGSHRRALLPKQLQCQDGGTARQPLNLDQFPAGGCSPHDGDGTLGDIEKLCHCLAEFRIRGAVDWRRRDGDFEGTCFHAQNFATGGAGLCPHAQPDRSFAFDDIELGHGVSG